MEAISLSIDILALCGVGAYLALLIAQYLASSFPSSDMNDSDTSGSSLSEPDNFGPGQRLFGDVLAPVSIGRRIVGLSAEKRSLLNQIVARRAV